MTDDERRRFDALLDGVVAKLPRAIHGLIEEAPVIVEDRPNPRLLVELGLDERDEVLCGMHSGVPLTERSISADDEGLETIHLFREGIVDHAGGWVVTTDDDGQPCGGIDRVREELRITLLHEIGHHFGLEEDDLAELGYG